MHLFYTRDPEEIEKADILIIPGSKNTIADMQFLRKTQLAKAILKAHEQHKHIIGICGGYQMLGISISDPHNLENDIQKIPGLGIIPSHTIMAPQKITKQREFSFQNQNTI